MNQIHIHSDNGLSPIRSKAIIWTNAGLLSIGPLGTNFGEILINIIFLFTKMHPFFPGGDGLSALCMNYICMQHYGCSCCCMIAAWLRQTSHLCIMFPLMGLCKPYHLHRFGRGEMLSPGNTVNPLSGVSTLLSSHSYSGNYFYHKLWAYSMKLALPRCSHKRCSITCGQNRGNNEYTHVIIHVNILRFK